jgi:hypothetical protein
LIGAKLGGTKGGTKGGTTPFSQQNFASFLDDSQIQVSTGHVWFETYFQSYENTT